ncbi:MAG: ABC transporter ATP-binding protein, partial [Ginsengibacter sp.]
LDNLIDRVIIVDNGELLLNASVHEISEKLCFKTVNELSNPDEILYSEDSLKGFSIVTKNTNAEESKVNLEHLFNAITEKPILAKAIFQN